MNGHSNHGGGGESPAVAVPVYRPAYNSGVTAMAGFDPWASANQGITNYTNTLLGLSQMKRQDMNDKMAMEDMAQRSKLVDLQTKSAQQSFDDQTALRAALASAKGGYLYPEPAGVGPYQPGPRVGISALAPQAQPAGPEDRLAVMADLASQGNTAAMEMYGKSESLTQKLAEHKAQAEVYGNAEGAAKVDAILKKMDASGKALENWMKVDPSGELARELIAANPTLFNGMDPSKMQLGDGKKTPPVFFPAADGGYTFFDGKEWKHVKAETPSADKFQLTEVPAADGKTAQKYRVNMTDGTMTPLGNPYAVKSQVPNVNVHTGGPTPVAQTTFVDPSTGNPLVFDKSTGTYSVATVKGGGVAPKPSSMSPEAAGKAQMVEQAISYIPTIKAELFDADGSVNRTLVSNIVARTPFTRGRELSTLLLDAVEAKLRVESGAAVPDSEVKRAARRFIPSPMDSPENVRIKMNNLEAFLKGTTQKINNGRGPAKPAPKSAAKSAAKRNDSYDGLLSKYAR